MKSYTSNVITLVLLWAMVMMLIAVNGCHSDAGSPEACLDGATRTITDMSGRKVVIPEKVARVACLEVLCYEKLFLLGEDDKIVVMYSTNAPWMIRTNPEVRKIPKIVGDPNMEELLRRKIDVAFFRYNPEQTREKMTALGIPGLLSQPMDRDFTDAGAFAAAIRKSVRLFGEVMGGKARTRAEEWCAYYDEKIRYVTARTEKIPRSHRPRVYYLRGPDALTTQGRNSNTLWYGEMAGANMVAGEIRFQGKTSVSMEDIIRWNPEYVFVGRHYSVDLVFKDERWRNIAAVRSGRVYPLPDGVFFWDGSTEGVLLMEYLAKTLHPDLFPHLDMVRELKEYYSRFYRYALTDDEAAKILRGTAPDGSRSNLMNN